MYFLLRSIDIWLEFFATWMKVLSTFEFNIRTFNIFNMKHTYLLKKKIHLQVHNVILAPFNYYNH